MKSDRKKLVKELDTAFSKFIRARDKKCVVCGSTERLQCGHLFSRASYSTRWDTDNCFAQCRNCNYNHEIRPYPFYQWYIKEFGQQVLDDLYFKHKQIVKFKNWELEDLIKYYSEKVKSSMFLA